MITTFYAFYDGECGLCAACRRWLDDQPQLVPVRFLPYQSEEALQLCPGLASLRPEREIVVMADTGEIYQGDAAWITLLWATAHWRSLAVDLSQPGLRGIAQKVVKAVSENRLTLSRWLGMTPDERGTSGTAGGALPTAVLRTTDHAPS
jgi:predicted DCC family thiol-disulfide oxidoreductase YuxK